jgi:hypothetical protein
MRVATASRSPNDDKMLAFPNEPAWSRSVYHLSVVRVADRDLLQADLTGAGFGTGFHCPVLLHPLRAMSSRAFIRVTSPIAEQTAPQGLASRCSRNCSRSSSAPSPKLSRDT